MKTTIDNQKQGAVCGILSVGGTLSLAAKYLGCHRNTIRNAARRDPQFAERMQNAQAGNEIQFLNTIHEAAKDPHNWQAARFALTHMYPDRYGRGPRTMPINDVGDLISQLIQAIVRVVPDAPTRQAIRVTIRSIIGPALRKAKENSRE